MSVIKRLWKLLIDKDLKKKDLCARPESVLPRLLRWGKMAMSLQKFS